VRAREVFAEKWEAKREALLDAQKAGTIPSDQPLPETLGAPPPVFAETGPTYLWITNVNSARGNMTACGSSGMSGAGGCS